jgi:dTMP kinase
MKQQTALHLRGKFITFEGGEGVGKSTQVEYLLANLKKLKIDSISTREPGGTKQAENIRSFILQGKSEEWGAGAEAVLFASARLNHVNELIAPNLEKGNWVVCDRFHDSTRAYQGLTGGVNDKLITELEDLALNGNEPDLTILLDMDPKAAFDRVSKRQADSSLNGGVDRFEKEDLKWHTRLRDGFLKIARNNRERIIIINANMSEQDLAKAVWSDVCFKFPELVQVNS